MYQKKIKTFKNFWIIWCRHDQISHTGQDYILISWTNYPLFTLPERMVKEQLAPTAKTFCVITDTKRDFFPRPIWLKCAKESDWMEYPYRRTNLPNIFGEFIINWTKPRWRHPNMLITLLKHCLIEYFLWYAAILPIPYIDGSSHFPISPSRRCYIRSRNWRRIWLYQYSQVDMRSSFLFLFTKCLK